MCIFEAAKSMVETSKYNENSDDNRSDESVAENDEITEVDSNHSLKLTEIKQDERSTSVYDSNFTPHNYRRIMMLAQKKKETKKAVVNESSWKKEEAYENYKSHFQFAFEPNFLGRCTNWPEVRFQTY